jgi:magnesium transporter
VIRALLSTPGAGVAQGGAELLGRGSRDPGSLLWIDCDCADPEATRELLTSRFGIEPLAVNDALRDRHPPKLEWFDDYLFLLVKGFTAETEDIHFDVVHISLFIGRDFLITVHRLPSPSIDALWSEAARGGIGAERGPAHLGYRILRRVVDRYAPVVLGLESRLDELEEEIAERPGDALLLELQGYILRLRKLRRTFGYQQSCFDELRQSGSSLLPEASAHEFQDLYEHMERMTSLSALLADLARDLRDGYISLSGHRLNTIMKTLTIASVIFLPLSFLAGIYGMNFDHMPELHAARGYYVLLGVMSAIAGTLLWVFRRTRWL